ncbi:MAG TPA: type III-A CRISPR-associated RAMP protein Csm5, partial [Chloroflexi bacterium]|nr:type III-A CRISPR-associated RAMP protein Csm5 [Chloroflexota bacterium]
MAEYILYDVQVRLLTPLHIGSGRELLHKYDYAIHGGRTWRLDEGAILAMQETDDPAWTARLTRIPPADLLREEDFRADAPYFRY